MIKKEDLVYKFQYVIESSSREKHKRKKLKILITDLMDQIKSFNKISSKI
jgi:hypothetical protein